MLRRKKIIEIVFFISLVVSVVYDYWTTNTLHVPSIIFLIGIVLYVIDFIRAKQ